MSESLTCKACQQLIQGAYVTALGTVWHPEHFYCAACGRPIDEPSFIQHEGAPYHTECYRLHVTPRCAYCGRPLLGQYLLDIWGTKFCAEHGDQYPCCRFCGRLVPPQHQGSQIGQGSELVCPACRSSEIVYVPQARPLFSRLVQWVNSQGLIYNQLALQIELLDQEALAQFMSQPGDTQCLGATLFTEYTEYCRVVRTEVRGVAILRGLPAVLFQGVTVHELGHAWLTVHHVTGLERVAAEGFCELLAYQFYREMDTVESRFYAKSKEHDPDPVYGEGFRRVSALAQSVGFGPMVECLRTRHHFPARL